MRIGFRRGAIQRLRRILRFQSVLAGQGEARIRGAVLKLRLVRLLGRSIPEVVAAQWALESAWGEHTSGHFNYFGIKATGSEPYSTCTTWEHCGGKDVEIQARFRDFDSLQECIDDLVTKWYHDYKSYKGVNRAQTVGECCQLLKQEGYATDPHYAAKLMSIINRQA